MDPDPVSVVMFLAVVLDLLSLASYSFSLGGAGHWVVVRVPAERLGLATIEP